MIYLVNLNCINTPEFLLLNWSNGSPMLDTGKHLRDGHAKIASVPSTHISDSHAFPTVTHFRQSRIFGSHKFPAFVLSRTLFRGTGGRMR